MRTTLQHKPFEAYLRTSIGLGSDIDADYCVVEEMAGFTYIYMTEMWLLGEIFYNVRPT